MKQVHKNIKQQGVESRLSTHSLNIFTFHSFVIILPNVLYCAKFLKPSVHVTLIVTFTLSSSIGCGLSLIEVVGAISAAIHGTVTG